MCSASDCHSAEPLDEVQKICHPNSCKEQGSESLYAFRFLIAMLQSVINLCKLCWISTSVLQFGCKLYLWDTSEGTWRPQVILPSLHQQCLDQRDYGHCPPQEILSSIRLHWDTVLLLRQVFWRICEDRQAWVTCTVKVYTGSHQGHWETSPRGPTCRPQTCWE